MTVEEAFGIIGRALETTDNQAWEALDVILDRLNQLEVEAVNDD
jgi:hypothetical protein